FNINGREGAQALDYDTLMRVGAAARAGGDLPNAVAIYRRAAVVTPSAPAPFVAAGNTLLEMGEINEAILAYRSALERVANDPEAVAVLRPLATAPIGSPRERQTLALIYGLAGDRKAAEQIARRDLDAASVQHNLAYYERLRKLSPEARRRAIQSLGSTNA